MAHLASPKQYFSERGSRMTALLINWNSYLNWRFLAPTLDLLSAKKQLSQPLLWMLKSEDHSWEEQPLLVSNYQEPYSWMLICTGMESNGQKYQRRYFLGKVYFCCSSSYIMEDHLHIGSLQTNRLAWFNVIKPTYILRKLKINNTHRTTLDMKYYFLVFWNYVHFFNVFILFCY